MKLNIVTQAVACVSEVFVIFHLKCKSRILVTFAHFLDGDRPAYQSGGISPWRKRFFGRGSGEKGI